MAGGSKAATVLSIVIVLAFTVSLLAPAAEAWSTAKSSKRETQTDASSGDGAKGSDASEKKTTKKTSAKRIVSRLRDTVDGIPVTSTALDALGRVVDSEGNLIDDALDGLTAASGSLGDTLVSLDGGASEVVSTSRSPPVYHDAPPAIHLAGAPRPVVHASTVEEAPPATVVPTTDSEARSRGDVATAALVTAPEAPLLPHESDPVQWAIVVGALGFSGIPALLVLRRRVERDGLLTHPVRRAMMDAVRARPGITTRGLAEALNLSPRAAMHHARLLAKFGAVDVTREGKFIRHFPRDNHFGRAQKQVHSVLSHEVTRAVAQVLVTDGPQNLGDLTARTALAKSTVLWHVRKLEDAGLATRAGPKAPVTIPDAMLPHLAQALSGLLAARVDPPPVEERRAPVMPSRV